MALISCPDCGKEVSSRANACIHCGCPLTEIDVYTTPPVAEKKAKPEKKKPAGRKLLLITAISAVVLVAAAVILYFCLFSPQAKIRAAYRQACTLYEKGQYSEALTILETLGDDPDSQQLTEYCKYMLASNAMSLKDWTTAISMLEEITYGDSQDLLQKCYYEMASETMTEGEWDHAISILANYKGEQGLELLTDCYYNLGIEAMEAFDWETAKSYFTDLKYKESERMLTDCSFMLELEQSVLSRMGTEVKDMSDRMTLVTTELARLEIYRKAQFYNSSIKTQAAKYIKGLDTQLDGLSYEFFYEYQRKWNTGLVARYEALDDLYRNFEFMADNADFIGTYINQLDYQQKWLKAFNGLEAGITELKMTYTYYYLEYQFKNDSPYSASYVFDFVFTSDEAGKNHLGSQTVSVANIGPYEEFTVRVYIPEAGRNGGYVDWTNYYSDIKVK